MNLSLAILTLECFAQLLKRPLVSRLFFGGLGLSTFSLSDLDFQSFVCFVVETNDKSVSKVAAPVDKMAF